MRLSWSWTQPSSGRYAPIRRNGTVPFSRNGCNSTEALENDLHYFGMKDIFSRELDIKVSGGEKQKISIIRACLKDSDLLILDEPNSALDKESTLLLKAKLKQLKSNKIILLITRNDQFDDIIDSVITI